MSQQTILNMVKRMPQRQRECGSACGGSHRRTLSFSSSSPRVGTDGRHGFYARRSHSPDRLIYPWEHRGSDHPVTDVGETVVIHLNVGKLASISEFDV